jgi:NAD(P)-dependent dehydrogenase (short-subunit alcohol dehydrogenase family)
MPAALVTGASTGIGRATALRLDSAGWRVFAGVRREADAESLRGEASERLTPMMLDVTDPAQIAAAAGQIGTALSGAGLDGLVNNAGVAIPSPLETMPIEDFRRQVEVNLTGQVAVTQAMLPLIRGSAVPFARNASQRNHAGRVVFISSIGGRIAFPLTGAYHAAKFGVEAVGDTFRQELRRWGISVSIVEPGSIDTPIWDRGERAADAVGKRATDGHETLYGKAIESYRKVVKETAERGIPPEKVAIAVEHALSARHPRARYLVGLDAKIQARLKIVIPTPVWDRIVARKMGFG